MEPKKISLMVIVFFVLLGETSFSQLTPYYTFEGYVLGTGAGDTIRALGQAVSAADVNHDGIPDFIVGAPNTLVDTSKRGHIVVYDGQTGDSLFTKTSERAMDNFGRALSYGRLNGDDFFDVIVGASEFTDTLFSTGSGRIYAFSGPDGSSLYDDSLHRLNGDSLFSTFGRAVSSSDIDQDSNDDIIVTGRYNGLDMAEMLFGSTFDAYDTVFSDTVNSQFGIAMATGGLVDTGSYPDIIIGASNYGVMNGRVYVYSGFNRTILYKISARTASENFGRSVDINGDVNNDGRDDLVVGAPQFSSGRGKVYVFSGSDTSTIRTFEGSGANDGLGNAVSSAGDFNGDGFADVLVGTIPGRVLVFSGQTGATLFDTTRSNEGFGTSLSFAGDVNSDGCDEIIIGAPEYDSPGLTDAGRAYVFLGISCCVGIRGDVNGDGADGQILDLNYLINSIFRGGPKPLCPKEADMNSDGINGNVLDLNFLVNWIFRGGSAAGPC